MNRTDRLLAMVLEIRARGEMRAEDLARTFHTSKRTIYRDIQALSEAGVPIVALMGQGYRLAEGYFLPPLAFTQDEATLILLGLGALDGSFDKDYQHKLDDARRKIWAVLNDSTRQSVDGLLHSLMLTQTHDLTPHDRDALRLLRRAIVEAQTVKFRYYSRHPGDGKVSLREADPYALACVNGVWLLTAYCHLRGERRTFRLSRIESLTLTPAHFQRPADYSVETERERDDRHVLVQVVIDEDALLWINEDRFFYIDQREPHPDGVLVTLRVRHSDEVLQWVLGWGQHVRVVAPLELRQRVQAEARAMLKNHSES